MSGDNGFFDFDPGRTLPPANRIVSLVPSITESLFELGLGERVVGITDFCAHPAAQLEGLPRLGGPKNPNLPAIVALQPDLVITNQEENTPPAVNALRESGLHVWLTFPRTVAEAMDILWALARLDPNGPAPNRLRVLEATLEWTEEAQAQQISQRFFCPVWQEDTPQGERWWMVFNHNTYCHDLLTLLGGENIFAGRDRRYPLEADIGQASSQDPGERDTRYPRVTQAEILAADPEVILLPSEPYPFSEMDLLEIEQLFSDTSAVRNGRVHLVDGSLITWHGTRLARALQDLPWIFAPPLEE